MMYLQQLPDYYSRTYSVEAYTSIIQSIASKRSRHVLYVGELGLTIVSKIRQIWETIKAWFGFENRTNKFKVNAELLKLLYYGQTQGFNSSSSVLLALQQLFHRIQQKEIRVSRSAVPLIDRLQKGETIPDFQAHLTHYFNNHRADLKPNRWVRPFSKAVTPLAKSFQFGDTYLALAESRQQRNPEKALKYFQKAAVLYQKNYGPLSSFFNQFATVAIFKTPELQQQIIHTHCLIAEKLYYAGDTERAANHFRRAHDYEAEHLQDFESLYSYKHLALWMMCCFANQDTLRAKEILLKLQNKPLKGESLELFKEGCFQVALSLQAEYSPPEPVKEYLTLALGVKRSPESFLLKRSYAYFYLQNGLHHVANKEWRIALEWLFRAPYKTQEELISTEGLALLEGLVCAIENLYKAEGPSQENLDVVVKALNLIDTKKQQSSSTPLHMIARSVLEFFQKRRSETPTELDPKLHFSKAKLHFLLAEMLTQLRGYALSQIGDQYDLAMRYAFAAKFPEILGPGTADSKDDQKQYDDASLKRDIEYTRAFARHLLFDKPVPT